MFICIRVAPTQSVKPPGRPTPVLKLCFKNPLSHLLTSCTYLHRTHGIENGLKAITILLLLLLLLKLIIIIYEKWKKQVRQNNQKNLNLQNNWIRKL